VDFDVVDTTNLQRQILHGTQAVGIPKLESARARIEDTESNVQVEHARDASDVQRTPWTSFVSTTAWRTERQLSHPLPRQHACVLLASRTCYGSIFRFEGAGLGVHAKEGRATAASDGGASAGGLVPSCAEGGVLASCRDHWLDSGPGDVKLILGGGETLVGRLLLSMPCASSFAS